MRVVIMAGRARESPDLFEEEEEFPTTDSGSEDEYETCTSPEKTSATAAAAGEASERGQKSSSRSLALSPTAPLSRIGLNDNKAGMEGLDRTKINQIILEATKGSKYYENELRKERQVQKRVQKMLEELKKMSPLQRAAALKAADRELEALESTRDLNHIIVHIDMDAFYASVEERDSPQLKDVPMAVGGKSMLSTSNYLARRYGVRAAMPGFIAKKLCPHLVIVPLHFDKYQEASGKVRDILAGYDHNFCPVGLDESYLDLTEFVKTKVDEKDTAGGEARPSNSEGSAESRDRLTPAHWRCAEEVVEGMRREIQEKTSLTASAGLAPNMMLAKVASDMNKPNGQFTVTATKEAVLQFVKKLPIRKISGIGKVTESMLNALGVTTCGDLYQQRAVLQLLFSQTSSSHFLRVSLGLGSTHVHRDHVRKSMSNERTFAEISEPGELQQKCLELCQELAGDMEHDAITGRTIAVKLKTVHFEVKTRALTLPQPISSAEQLYSSASELLEAEIRACSPSPLRLRLMGVRISSLQRGEESEQEGRGSRGKQETLDMFVQQPAPPTFAATSFRAEGGGGTTDTVRCPVCGRKLKETQLQSINAHIDECLNLPVISSITSATSGTDQRLTAPQFKTESPKKRNYTLGIISPHKQRGKEGARGINAGSKKRATETENSATSTKRRKTLDQFWN